jgi:hypothetical protein
MVKRINWNTRVESYSGPYQGKKDIEDKGLEGEEDGGEEEEEVFFLI